MYGQQPGMMGGGGVAGNLAAKLAHLAGQQQGFPSQMQGFPTHQQSFMQPQPQPQPTLPPQQQPQGPLGPIWQKPPSWQQQMEGAGQQQFLQARQQQPQQMQPSMDQSVNNAWANQANPLGQHQNIVQKPQQAQPSMNPTVRAADEAPWLAMIQDALSRSGWSLRQPGEQSQGYQPPPPASGYYGQQPGIFGWR